MRFKSKQIKGKGRGKILGFPTINLKIPENFRLMEGIYVVKVFIETQAFTGAMHFGPIPTFNEDGSTLEVFIIDVSPENLPDTENLNIEIETVKYLRSIINFANEEELIKQIGEDVLKARQILNTNL